MRVAQSVRGSLSDLADARAAQSYQLKTNLHGGPNKSKPPSHTKRHQ